MNLELDFHNPFHLQLDNRIYWITASTLGHARILDDPAKAAWRDVLKDLAKQDGTHLYAWVVLDDHYHLLVWLREAKGLPALIHKLHGRSSRTINKMHGVTGRRIWYQYWDRCIRDERDFYVRLNYLHHNPVKHSYVANVGEYPFSSYGYYARRYGTEWLADLWSRHPVVDFTPEEGDGSQTLE